ncbi:hypothetical protein LBYS11_16365 [Lysinibacillus sp. YS11]|uniref:hypothetical protein n=1 Tax=Lysinibacillus sp. YS11 TaxID=2072025 RepID=UPI000CA154E1|nr:hypothetical protein [Lysinibacillus sp. YS11]AUS87812.1 hypothetical protein LBYS11_16365 [Lysinibacillus sp. YS11]
MNLIEAISNLSDQSADKTEKLSYLVLKSKDINGGLGFEEEIREIWISKGSWEIRKYTEQTIQPDNGQTISKKKNVSESTISDERLLELITNGNLDIHEVSELLKNIIKTLNLPRL